MVRDGQIYQELKAKSGWDRQVRNEKTGQDLTDRTGLLDKSGLNRQVKNGGQVRNEHTGHVCPGRVDRSVICRQVRT